MVANYLYQSSITALRGEAKAFNVISSNIANATTPGHKAESTQFSDLMVERSGGTLPAFRGTNARVRTDIYKEGVISPSAGEFDVALAGRGFFVVNSQLNGSGTTLFTDSGEFQRRLVTNGGVEEAYIVDSFGNFVQGFPFDATTNTFTTSTTLGGTQPIRVDGNAANFTAQATTALTMDMNLPPDVETGEFFDIGFSIFDGTGAADGVSDDRAMTARFTKNATFNEWSVAIAGASAGTNATVTTGAAFTMTFDTTGNIVSSTTQALAVTFASPAATTTSTIDFTRMRSFANQFVLREASNDGFLEGQLSDTSINAKGEIVGIFSNGQTRPIAKIAIADLVNPESLVQANNTHFALGNLSGTVTLYEIDQTARASLSPAALEGSTTDIAAEFTKMIMTQQAYNSAARTLQIVDGMLETATNMK